MVPGVPARARSAVVVGEAKDDGATARGPGILEHELHVAELRQPLCQRAPELRNRRLSWQNSLSAS
jgi:hypothetical protein